MQLFSTVLRKDADGKTYLVTPVEKVGISVVDAPFVAVEMDVSGEGAGDQRDYIPHQCRRRGRGRTGTSAAFCRRRCDTGGLKPYVLVRGRLEALVARPVMYELVGHGEEIEVGGRTMFAVRSNGVTYPIMPADKLRRLSA